MFSTSSATSRSIRRAFRPGAGIPIKSPAERGQEKIRQLLVYNRKLAAGEIGKAKDDRVVYRDDKPAGTALPAGWIDIKYLASAAKERANYPTQKPLALPHRIIAAASNPGDVALDPFAGGATAGVAAEQRGRRWLGIEIGEEGYRQVVRRMRDTVKLASKDTPLLLEPERVITRREELPGQRTDYPLAPPPEARKRRRTDGGAAPG